MNNLIDMQCKEKNREQLLRYIFNMMSQDELIKMQEHLSTCGKCIKEVERLRGTRKEFDEVKDRGIRSFIIEKSSRARFIMAAALVTLVVGTTVTITKVNFGSNKAFNIQSPVFDNHVLETEEYKPADQIENIEENFNATDSLEKKKMLDSLNQAARTR